MRLAVVFQILIGGVALTFCTGAGPWTLTPIAQSATDQLSDAQIVNGTVMYQQANGNTDEIKQWSNGTTTTLVDNSVAIPGGSGNFKFLGLAAFDGTHLLFTGADTSNHSGLYELSAGVFSEIANNTTAIPGLSGKTFAAYGAVSVSGSKVVFYGEGVGTSYGVYDADSGGVHVVAAAGTIAPNGVSSFADVGAGLASSSGAIIFSGHYTDASNHSVHGVYSFSNGQITTVLDSNTAYPGGGMFNALAATSVDGADVAGYGGATNVSGVFYKLVNGTVYNVADFNHSAPGLTGNLTSIQTGSIMNGSVVFKAGDGNNEAILTDVGGTLSEIVASGETLDGKIVANTLSVTGQAFDGNDAVLNIPFTDGSTAIYIVALPEPGLASVAACATLLLARRRRIRGR